MGAQDATIDLVMLAAAARPLVGVGDLAEQIAVGCVGPPVCRKPTAIGTSTPLFRGRAALIVVVPQGIPCGTIAIMDVEAPGSSPAFRSGSGLAVTGVTCVAVSSSLGLRRLGRS